MQQLPISSDFNSSRGGSIPRTRNIAEKMSRKRSFALTKKTNNDHLKRQLRSQVNQQKQPSRNDVDQQLLTARHSCGQSLPQQKENLNGFKTEKDFKISQHQLPSRNVEISIKNLKEPRGSQTERYATLSTRVDHIQTRNYRISNENDLQRGVFDQKPQRKEGSLNSEENQLLKIKGISTDKNPLNCNSLTNMEQNGAQSTARTSYQNQSPRIIQRQNYTQKRGIFKSFVSSPKRSTQKITAYKSSQATNTQKQIQNAKNQLNGLQKVRRNLLQNSAINQNYMHQSNSFKRNQRQIKQIRDSFQSPRLTVNSLNDTRSDQDELRSNIMTNSSKNREVKSIQQQIAQERIESLISRISQPLLRSLSGQIQQGRTNQQFLRQFREQASQKEQVFMSQNRQVEQNEEIKGFEMNSSEKFQRQSQIYQKKFDHPLLNSSTGRSNSLIKTRSKLSPRNNFKDDLTFGQSLIPQQRKNSIAQRTQRGQNRELNLYQQPQKDMLIVERPQGRIFTDKLSQVQFVKNDQDEAKLLCQQNPLLQSQDGILDTPDFEAYQNFVNRKSSPILITKTKNMDGRQERQQLVSPRRKRIKTANSRSVVSQGRRSEKADLQFQTQNYVHQERIDKFKRVQSQQQHNQNGPNQNNTLFQRVRRVLSPGVSIQNLVKNQQEYLEYDQLYSQEQIYAQNQQNQKQLKTFDENMMRILNQRDATKVIRDEASLNRMIKTQLGAQDATIAGQLQQEPKQIISHNEHEFSEYFDQNLKARAMKVDHLLSGLLDKIQEQRERQRIQEQKHEELVQELRRQNSTHDRMSSLLQPEQVQQTLDHQLRSLPLLKDLKGQTKATTNHSFLCSNIQNVTINACSGHKIISKDNADNSREKSQKVSSNSSKSKPLSLKSITEEQKIEIKDEKNSQQMKENCSSKHSLSKSFDTKKSAKRVAKNKSSHLSSESFKKFKQLQKERMDLLNYNLVPKQTNMFDKFSLNKQQTGSKHKERLSPARRLKSDKNPITVNRLSCSTSRQSKVKSRLTESESDANPRISQFKKSFKTQKRVVVQSQSSEEFVRDTSHISLSISSLSPKIDHKSPSVKSQPCNDKKRVSFTKLIPNNDSNGQYQFKDSQSSNTLSIPNFNRSAEQALEMCKSQSSSGQTPRHKSQIQKQSQKSLKFDNNGKRKSQVEQKDQESQELLGQMLKVGLKIYGKLQKGQKRSKDKEKADEFMLKLQKALQSQKICEKQSEERKSFKYEASSSSKFSSDRNIKTVAIDIIDKTPQRHNSGQLIQPKVKEKQEKISQIIISDQDTKSAKLTTNRKISSNTVNFANKFLHLEPKEVAQSEHNAQVNEPQQIDVNQDQISQQYGQQRKNRKSLFAKQEFASARFVKSLSESDFSEKKNSMSNSSRLEKHDDFLDELKRENNLNLSISNYSSKSKRKQRLSQNSLSQSLRNYKRQTQDQAIKKPIKMPEIDTMSHQSNVSKLHVDIIKLQRKLTKKVNQIITEGQSDSVSQLQRDLSQQSITSSNSDSSEIQYVTKKSLKCRKALRDETYLDFSFMQEINLMTNSDSCQHQPDVQLFKNLLEATDQQRPDSKFSNKAMETERGNFTLFDNQTYIENLKGNMVIENAKSVEILEMKNNRINFQQRFDQIIQRLIQSRDDFQSLKKLKNGKKVDVSTTNLDEFIIQEQNSDWEAKSETSRQTPRTPAERRISFNSLHQKPMSIPDILQQAHSRIISKNITNSSTREHNLTQSQQEFDANFMRESGEKTSLMLNKQLTFNQKITKNAFSLLEFNQYNDPESLQSFERFLIREQNVLYTQWAISFEIKENSRQKREKFKMNQVLTQSIIDDPIFSGSKINVEIQKENLLKSQKDLEDFNIITEFKQRIQQMEQLSILNLKKKLLFFNVQSDQFAAKVVLEPIPNLMKIFVDNYLVDCEILRPQNQSIEVEQNLENFQQALDAFLSSQNSKRWSVYKKQKEKLDTKESKLLHLQNNNLFFASVQEFQFLDVRNHLRQMLQKMNQGQNPVAAPLDYLKANLIFAAKRSIFKQIRNKLFRGVHSLYRFHNTMLEKESIHDQPSSLLHKFNRQFKISKNQDEIYSIYKSYVKNLGLFKERQLYRYNLSRQIMNKDGQLNLMQKVYQQQKYEHLVTQNLNQALNLIQHVDSEQKIRQKALNNQLMPGDEASNSESNDDMLEFEYQRQTALVQGNMRDSLRRSFAKRIYDQTTLRSQYNQRVVIPQRLEPLLKQDGTHRSAFKKDQFFDYFMMACRLRECQEINFFMEVYYPVKSPVIAKKDKGSLAIKLQQLYQPQTTFSERRSNDLLSNITSLQKNKTELRQSRQITLKVAEKNKPNHIIPPKRIHSSSSIELSNILGDIPLRGEDSIYTDQSIADVHFEDLLHLDGFYDGNLTVSSDWGLETDIINLELTLKLLNQTQSQYAFYNGIEGGQKVENIENLAKTNHELLAQQTGISVFDQNSRLGDSTLRANIKRKQVQDLSSQYVLKTQVIREEKQEKKEQQMFNNENCLLDQGKIADSVQQLESLKNQYLFTNLLNEIDEDQLKENRQKRQMERFRKRQEKNNMTSNIFNKNRGRMLISRQSNLSINSHFSKLVALYSKKPKNSGEIERSKTSTANSQVFSSQLKDSEQVLIKSDGKLTDISRLTKPTQQKQSDSQGAQKIDFNNQFANLQIPEIISATSSSQSIKSENNKSKRSRKNVGQLSYGSFQEASLKVPSDEKENSLLRLTIQEVVSRPGSANLLKRSTHRDTDIKLESQEDQTPLSSRNRRKLSRSYQGSISGLDTFLRAKSCVGPKSRRSYHLSAQYNDGNSSRQRLPYALLSSKQKKSGSSVKKSSNLTKTEEESEDLVSESSSSIITDSSQSESLESKFEIDSISQEDNQLSDTESQKSHSVENLSKMSQNDQSFSSLGKISNISSAKNIKIGSFSSKNSTSSILKRASANVQKHDSEIDGIPNFKSALLNSSFSQASMKNATDSSKSGSRTNQLKSYQNQILSPNSFQRQLPSNKSSSIREKTFSDALSNSGQRKGQKKQDGSNKRNEIRVRLQKPGRKKSSAFMFEHLKKVDSGLIILKPNQSNHVDRQSIISQYNLQNDSYKNQSPTKIQIRGAFRIPQSILKKQSDFK